MTSEVFPEGNTSYTQTWDTEGRVDSQTDSEGNTNSLAVDTPLEGITTLTDPLSNTIAHTHQNMKNLVQYEDQDGEAFSLSYDANNRRNGLTVNGSRKVRRVAVEKCGI
jgi:YD repeat-containing protein